MAVFHLHIISTVPMGVPLEWNLFFIFSLFFLFGAYGDITVYDLDNPLLLVVLLPALLGLPLLGNLRPDLVSFLPAMRYYAGNWATSAWLFRDDAEQRLETDLVGASRLPMQPAHDSVRRGDRRPDDAEGRWPGARCTPRAAP